MAIRKTKIICTIGPAVESEEKIKALISAGMDAARFNFSLGSHEEHKARIDLVKPGTTILIDDSLISKTVTDIVNGDMVC